MRVQVQQRRFQLGADMPIHPRRQLPSPLLACRGVPAFHQQPGIARFQHPFLHHLRLIAPEPGSRGKLRRWTLDFLMNLDGHRLAPLRRTRSRWCRFVGRFPGRGRFRLPAGCRFHSARLDFRTGLFSLHNGTLLLQPPDLFILLRARFPQFLNESQQRHHPGRLFVRRYFWTRRELLHGAIQYHKSGPLDRGCQGLLRSYNLRTRPSVSTDLS